jgi:hypothetical protein
MGLVSRMITAASGRHKDGKTGTRQDKEKDLAQRVREVGEW